MRFGFPLLAALAVGCAAVDVDSSGGPLVGDGVAALTFERPEVGVVYWNGAACSGTLIRDNVVLTAARCVGFGANDGRGAALGNFVVYQDAERSAQFAFDAFVSFGDDVGAEATSANDVALLRLTARVPADVARPAALAVRQPNADEGVSRFGFACGDRDDLNQGKKQKVSFAHGRTVEACLFDSGGPTFLDRDGSVFQVNGAGGQTFGDVVLHRADLEAQAAAWAGGSAGAGEGPAQDLTCDGLRRCVEGCGADIPCRQVCGARTAPTPRRLYDSLIACSQASSCPDFACVELACGEQLRACGGGDAGEPGVARPPVGGLSCPELLGCGQQCGADAACFEACRGRAADEALRAYDGYAGCFRAHDCQDGECARLHCDAEYGACAGLPDEPQVADPGGGAGPGGAQPGDEPGGGDAPPDADSELPNTDPGPGPEAGRSEPPPPELTCREVLECAQRCGDPSCQQDCYFQGRVIAQIAYSALALCGTLHLCFDANCLQIHCASQYETCITGRYVPPPPRSGGGGPDDPCGC